MAQKKYKPSYWEKRSIDAEKRVNDGAKALEKKVASAYRQAQSYLTKQARKMFARSQQRTGLSEEEAKRLLNETVQPEELVELKSLSKQIKNPLLQKEAKQKLNGLAFKERITRVEDLKAKSFFVSKQVANVQLDKSTDFYIDTIHDSYNEATSEAIIRQMEHSNPNSIIEVWNKKEYESSLESELPKHEFKELSTRYTKNILDSHWKGSNYSERIWGDTEALAKRLEELFTVESMTGMSEFEMAKEIASEFDRSIGVARRLIRTEANYMANQAKLKAWQDRGVEQYILIAVLDLRTSKICQGKDHKIYLVSEAIVNGKEGTYPPFHPWCRTIAVAYFGERTLSGTRTANDPISGKTILIDQRDSYNDWMDKLKEMYSTEEINRQKQKLKNKNYDDQVKKIKSRAKKDVSSRFNAVRKAGDAKGSKIP
ncbi:minor capsid protein [Enterococcus caccae]|uniref:SPP1 gp7 family phage head morphogenesis protein n=1 Tax=Enterococcus caccae ATCC BAA-1240 TaxID=1158612 RepID=R3WD35_9ENTE|nr:minor capsid protein [Enterococcus caccae]EOL45811.1 SPP1 gp7 family phage head morphogenesis protein [Enterococcus caccae ATCC BAA-1240]EOT61007.1 hypothetical protein I580_01909 [Enterococcus caccae ATCC BAA-1240]OJG27962.1 SPP1 gp7 family phage head morphogenesis protein [Enterococcus caccae]